MRFLGGTKLVTDIEDKYRGLANKQSERLNPSQFKVQWAPKEKICHYCKALEKEAKLQFVLFASVILYRIGPSSPLEALRMDTYIKTVRNFWQL
jgi:hypothetical protein